MPDGCTHGIGSWLQAYTQSGKTWRAYIQLASIRQAKGFALLLNISYTCIYILSCHAWPDTTDESFITSSHSRIQVDCIAMIYSSHSNGLRNSWQYWYGHGHAPSRWLRQLRWYRAFHQCMNPSWSTWSSNRIQMDCEPHEDWLHVGLNRKSGCAWLCFACFWTKINEDMQTSYTDIMYNIYIYIYMCLRLSLDIYTCDYIDQLLYACCGFCFVDGIRASCRNSFR